MAQNNLAEKDLQPRWWVECRDTAGRRRRLTVLVSGGNLVIALPPGETATLDAAAAAALSRILREAAWLIESPTS